MSKHAWHAAVRKKTECPVAMYPQDVDDMRPAIADGVVLGPVGSRILVAIARMSEMGARLREGGLWDVA